MNTNHPPVTPEEIEEARLTAYALDQLDDGERKLVETLLQGDPKARRTVEETRRVAEMLREAMRQAPPTGPSSSLRSAVDQYLESGQAEEPPVEPVSPAAKHDPSPRRWLAVRWAAAALAVCFLAGVTAVLYGPRLPRVRELAETRRPLHQSEPALAPASSPLPAIEADQASPGAADKRALDELRTRGAADEPSAGAALQASSSGEVVGRSVAKAGAVLKGAPSTHHDWKYGAAPVATAAPSTAPSAGLSPPSDAAAPAGSPALAAKPDTGLAARALMRRAETATGSQDESLRRSRKAEESVAPRSAATASRPEAPSEAGGYPGMMPGMEIGFPAAAPALQAEEPLDPRSAARASRPEAPSEAGGYPGMTPGMMPGMEMGSPAAAPALQAEASVGREWGDRMAKQDAREGGGMGGAAYGAGGYGQEKIKEQSDLALLESASGVGAYSPEGLTRSDDADQPAALEQEALGNQPASGETYAPIVENPFLPVAQDPLSTFSIDVDTASYANVRRFLREGRLPPADAVRIEEMVNYFPYDYPLPEGDAPFAVDLEVAQCPWQPEHRLLRVGLKGKEVHPKERGASNLVFLIDVSGSMDQPNKLPLVKAGMTALVEQLGRDDRVAIVTYAGQAGVQLPSTPGQQRETIARAIDALQAGGSTAGAAGIMLAYEQATEHFISGGNNRVILATDGDLNVGITDDAELVKLIEGEARTGVFLTVLGFGTGNLQDAKLEKLADHGNGLYAYIDDGREARRVLVEQMSGSLVTIAKDVKLQIEFNPAEVAAYRLIGYENRVLAHAEFDDDRKDAGDIGAGHTATALYELVPAAEGEVAVSDGADLGLRYQRPQDRSLTPEAGSGEWASLRLRYKNPEDEESRLLTFSVSDSGHRFGQASPDFQFASAVAAFGMVLRGSRYCEATLPAVEEYATSGLGRDPGGYRAEFVELLGLAQRLR